MTSELEPTEAQRLTDEAFIEDTRLNYVTPLIEELSQAIDGFEGMDYEHRLFEVIRLNEPFVGKGDSLMLGDLHGYLRMPVYSGQSLAAKPQKYVCGDSCIERYVPRFSSDMGGLGLINHERDGIGKFLQQERETYDSLPVSYRAALLVLYVQQNIATDFYGTGATEFVLGCANLEPQRVARTQVANSDGLFAGWLVRIRDNKPPQSFAIELASSLRSHVKKFENSTVTIYVNKHPEPVATLSFDGFEKLGKRSTNKQTALAYAYIDTLRARGHKIGRGGDMTWGDVCRNVNELLFEKYGDEANTYADGNSLRDGYRKYKQRQGER